MAENVEKNVVQEVPSSPPVVSPPSVEQLVAEAIGQLPQLGSRPETLRRVMTVLATYVGGPDIPVVAVDKETAATELELMQGWTTGDVETACEEVMNRVGEALEELRAEFEAKSGTAVEGVDFEAFNRRYTGERQEQAGLVTRANRLLEAVKNVSGQMGIVNPDPGLQPPVPEMKKESFLSRVGLALAISGRYVTSPFIVIPMQAESQESKPLLSWQTLPVLTDEDRDLRLMGLVQARLAAQSDVQLVARTLENLGLGRDALTELMARVAGKAREQLAQSQEILQSAAGDYQQFSARARAIQDMQGIILGVHNFFFPEEAQAKN